MVSVRAILLLALVVVASSTEVSRLRAAKVAASKTLSSLKRRVQGQSLAVNTPSVGYEVEYSFARISKNAQGPYVPAVPASNGQEFCAAPNLANGFSQMALVFDGCNAMDGCGLEFVTGPIACNSIADHKLAFQAYNGIHQQLVVEINERVKHTVAVVVDNIRTKMDTVNTAAYKIPATAGTGWAFEKRYGARGSDFNVQATFDLSYKRLVAGANFLAMLTEPDPAAAVTGGRAIANAFLAAIKNPNLIPNANADDELCIKAAIVTLVVQSRFLYNVDIANVETDEGEVKDNFQVFLKTKLEGFICMTAGRALGALTDQHVDTHLGTAWGQYHPASKDFAIASLKAAKAGREADTTKKMLWAISNHKVPPQTQIGGDWYIVSEYRSGNPVNQENGNSLYAMIKNNDDNARNAVADTIIQNIICAAATEVVP